MVINKLQLNHSTLHRQILLHVIENGFAPSLSDLATHFSASRGEVRQALRALAQYHGIVLHPSNDQIWVIHPFSMAPTNFWVESAKSSWWANCAWCALGAAALLNRNVNITTTIGGERHQVAIEIVDGELSNKDFVVHFPVPMIKCWDNVIFTCSVMCLFDGETAVDDWCLRHNIQKGDVQPLETVWRFSKAWYGNHLSPTWTKWTAAEAQALFQQFGFTGRIWDFPAGDGRF